MEQIGNANQQKPARPNNYLALAIISTIVCCMPLGIVSIIYSTKVNSEYERGDYALAEKSSKNAKTWGLVSIGLGVLLYVLIFVLYGVAIMGAIANG